MVHSSVLSQTIELPQLTDNVKANPSLIAGLLDLEDIFKTRWPYVPGKYGFADDEMKSELKAQESMKKTLEKRVKEVKDGETKAEVMVDEGGRPRYVDSWLGSVLHELID